MNYDSFLPPHHTTRHNAFTSWWRWSLAIALGTLGTISTVHLHTAHTYAEQIKRCASCEQQTIKSQPQHTEHNAVSQEYATLAEHIHSLREYLTNKARLATLASDLIKGTHTPITLQSATLAARDCSLIFRCPPTYAIHTLTDRLSKNHPQLSFRVARLEQRDDALLVTVQAAFTTPATPTKS